MRGFVKISPKTADELFLASLRADPTQPLLTWYDDLVGDRTELSGTTVNNWRAKTANLLVDECGLGSGDTAVIALPPHWQTAAILLGTWAAGLAVGDTGEVLFASVDRAATADPGAADRYALGLAPLGMPLRGPAPDGFVDYISAVRGHGDFFTAATPPQADDLAWTVGGADLTHAALCAAASARAATLGIEAGSRVLIDTGAHPDPLDWLLAPLAVGASAVICANLDRARLATRCADERIAVSLT